MGEQPTSDTMTRGHKKRARTRRLLIEAAVDVVGEQGAGFAVSDVTDRAGVSNGTFYNYFDDREQLLGALVPELIGEFAVVSAASIRHDDPALQFAAVSASALRQAVVAPDRVRAVLRLDGARASFLRGDGLDHLRSDIRVGVASSRFEVPGADGEPGAATLDVVVGALLLAVERLIGSGRDDDYAIGVVAQLLRSLGLTCADAADVAQRAVASIMESPAAD